MNFSYVKKYNFQILLYTSSSYGYRAHRQTLIKFWANKSCKSEITTESSFKYFKVIENSFVSSLVRTSLVISGQQMEIPTNAISNSNRHLPESTVIFLI